MTIDEAHTILGINKDITLNEIAKKYTDYIKVNPIEYKDWLEQEVILHLLCMKIGKSEQELLNILGISREELVNKHINNEVKKDR